MHKIVALYKFCRITELKYFQNIIKAQLSSLNILGTIIIGEEGINGTISGTENSLLKATSFLQSIDQFQGIDLKESSSAKKPFLRLKIKIKDEIVSMGLKNIDPTTQAGQYVDPKDWNSLIDNKDTILIDTRNDYEYSIGSFENSINPETKNFKEFPNWVDKQEFSKSDKKSKNVAMFCTGGIRCEKAFSHLIPPVQNIATFFDFLSDLLNSCLSTQFGNSLKFLVSGLIEFSNDPIEYS